MKTGTALRRFQKHGKRSQWSALDPNHPAVIFGHTRYPARVVDPRHVERVFKSGHHNRKIGKEVQKGAWKGYPIFTLTLQERATCPRSCLQWHDCYGNKMGHAPRHKHGVDLELQIMREIKALSERHPRGFVIRLHVLGDFYDVGYAELWETMVELVRPLHVFGYTAHGPRTPIGAVIARTREKSNGRFAVRHSNSDRPEWSTWTTYPADPPPPHLAITCPAQIDKTECCATCTLCWSTPKPIEFIAH
jgi:hypothetical protein